MSVYAQLKSERVTEGELYEKYGPQFARARRKFPNECPDTLIQYLKWRAESSDGSRDGDKVVYYLFDPDDAPAAFRRGRVCLRLQWPASWKTDILHPAAAGGLWLDGVSHGMVHTPEGVVWSVSVNSNDDDNNNFSIRK